MQKPDHKVMKRTLGTAIVLTLIFSVGFVAGFDNATGGFAMGFFGGSSILPPDEIAQTTLANVESILDTVADMDYDEGYNCLDFAWDAMRHLHWNGQLATIVQLDLDPGPAHAVVLVPTSDAGYVFIEPQTGERIYPTVGGNYIDFAVIKGIYIMNLTWTSLEQYVTDIDEGVVDTSGLSYYRVND